MALRFLVHRRKALRSQPNHPPGGHVVIRGRHGAPIFFRLTRNEAGRGRKLSRVLAFRRFGYGGFGILLVACASLAQADMTAHSTGTNLAGPGSTGAGAIESAGSCVAEQTCIDGYLWSLYERTPKVDTVKVAGTEKVTVKRKGKTSTVTKATSKLVGEDFTWKDPKAAEVAGMSTTDYVIGGMDPGFRRTLYHALRALDDAGLKPGIMCAFRDD
jgi:hypothetical protein